MVKVNLYLKKKMIVLGFFLYEVLDKVYFNTGIFIYLQIHRQYITNDSVVFLFNESFNNKNIFFWKLYYYSKWTVKIPDVKKNASMMKDVDILR